MLSWNEIRHRAIVFATDWATTSRERAEAHSFWDAFFTVFGMRRRLVATFEEPVRLVSGTYHYIDLFWPGRLLVEHKSAGADLSLARSQGLAYVRELHAAGRTQELPRYLLVSDFRHLALHDLDAAPGAPDSSLVFPLAELHLHVRRFAFIAGYTPRVLDPEDPANEHAVQLMCDLHDALAAGGYRGHDLHRFLVRVLFCLFAEDTGIFPPDSFRLYLIDHTAEDGSDLGLHLERLFHVLNTPDTSRQPALNEDLRQFPYVNGALFQERLEFAD